MGIVADVSVLPDRVKRELVRGEHARAEFAIRAQTALKEAMDQMGPIRHVEGIGRRVTTIHPELAARIRTKFGVRCLHDPDFLRSLLRENPFLRVQTVPKKLAIRVNGLRDQPEQQFQNGKGNGARGATAAVSALKGDPATPSVCPTERGSVLCLSPGQRSGHETPARSEPRSRRSEVGGQT